jgi:RNA polymerase sigma-70 factor, ECF subfamily
VPRGRFPAAAATTLNRSVPEVSDEELLGLIAAGHREALGMLYGRYQDVVFRFAFQMSGNESVAEDIVQDTFLVMTRAAKRYRASDAQFSTYLYGIVRNLTRRRLRRDSRAWSLRSWGGLLWAAHQPSTEQSLVDQATAQQKVERVRRAVLSLPARYREVVVLCDLHGRNYADTAAIVGCPVGTIRSRLHRGRDLLREKLGLANRD